MPVRDKNKSMKKSFLGKVLMMASFVAILGGFSSCQDYSEERYSDVLSKLENQNTTLEQALAAQKQALEAKIAELQAAQEACKAECAEKMSQLEAKWNAELAAQVALLKAEDAKLGEQIAAINGVIGDVAGLEGKTIVEQIVALNKAAAAVNDTIVAWGPRLTAVEKEAAAAKNQADVNKAAIENLDSIAQAHKEQIEGLTKELKDSLTAIQAQAAANLEAAQKYADDQIAVMMGNVSDSLNDVKEEILGSISGVQSELLDSLSSVNTAMMDSVSQLADAMALTDSILADRLDSLEARVSALEEQVAENTQAIENLTGALKKLVTSVVLQGTKNPVMGSIATPFNTRSNILAAYYGSVGSEGLEFPTDLPRYYVDGVAGMTYEDIQMLGVEAVTKDEGIVLLGDEGNAGTVYMTINPNTVDFTGLNVALVNSQDEFSGAELTSLAPSDEVLSFGYTRAAKNGFYEAKATISEESLEDVKLSLNFNEIKEVAKDFANGGGINVSQLATTVANTMSSFVMDANGIKVSWTDSLCEEEHSTYSQYGVAVTAVKPLSYEFGKDFAYTQVPGLDRMESFIGKMTEKAKAAIKKTDKLLNVELIKVDTIVVPETPQVDSIEVVVDVPGQWIKDDALHQDSIYVEGYNDTIRVSIQDVVNDLYGDLTGSFNDVNVMLKDVKEMIDKVNNIIQDAKDLQADAIKATDKLQAKLTKYLNIFSDKFCSVINSTNKVLRPVMLVSTTDGFHKVSQAKNNPSVITGTELELIPTSYSMEYIAPAYKKLVGVTNVFKGNASAQAGDAACKAALDKVNAQEGVAEVLAGDTYTVSATFEPGYVYEVVYTSVDFYGKVDAKKYFVTVK